MQDQKLPAFVSTEAFNNLKKVVNRVVESPRSDFYRTEFEKENFNPEQELKNIWDILKIPPPGPRR